VISNVSNGLAPSQPEFKEFLGKSLNEIGFYRIKKDENN